MEETESARPGQVSRTTHFGASGSNLNSVKQLRAHDGQTQAKLMVGRYFGQFAGRFLSTDPLQLLEPNLGNPKRWNQYIYAASNPLRFIDPDGLDVTVPLAFRKYVANAYRHSSCLRLEFDNAKSNPLVHITLSMTKKGLTTAGGHAKLHVVRTLDGNGRPISGRYNVTGATPAYAVIPDSDAGLAAKWGHELAHVNNKALNGGHEGDQCFADSEEALADQAQAAILQEYGREPALEPAAAEAALAGTEPQRQRRKQHSSGTAEPGFVGAELEAQGMAVSYDGAASNSHMKKGFLH